MGMIMGMFTREMGFGDSASEAEQLDRPRSALDDLRLAVERAEDAGLEEELLDHMRARLSEVEEELRKELAITVRGAVDGSVLAVVRARPTDTVARLREGVLQEIGDSGAVFHFIFQSQVLNSDVTLAEAGISDGSVVQLMQAQPAVPQESTVLEDTEAVSASEALGAEEGEAAFVSEGVGVEEAEVISKLQEPSEYLTITVRRAVSSEVVTSVRAKRSDTVSCLHQAVLRQSWDAAVALHFVFNSQILEARSTLEQVGLSDGDVVHLVQTPLRCLTASADCSARLWQLQGGAREEALVMQPSGPVLLAALSPSRLRLLTVSSDGEGEVWCTETGKPVCSLNGTALSGEFSSDSSLVVGPCDDDAARVWCAETGACKQLLEGHEDDVKAASFSPDGALIVTASSDGTARFWATDSGECLRTLKGHDDVVKSASFSLSGLQVITASMDTTARVWAVPSGECKQVLAGHTKALSSANFSPSARQMLTASFDGTVKLWQAPSGECTLTLPADNNVVNTAAFSPDGYVVLIASGSERIRLFDAVSGECVITLTGHEDWVRAASFSPDGMLVASASYDGTARIWSMAIGECLQTLKGHTGAVFSAEITAA